MSERNGNLIVQPDAPAYHIDEFVGEVMGRFSPKTREALTQPVKALVTGLVDQLWLKGLTGDVVTPSERLFEFRVQDDGRVVINMGSAPAMARPW